MAQKKGMSKTAKYIILGVLVAGAIFGVVRLLRRPKFDENTGLDESNKDVTEDQTTPTSNDKFPLKVGSKGENVALMQKKLNNG
jgi:hypothetical protein